MRHPLLFVLLVFLLACQSSPVQEVAEQEETPDHFSHIKDEKARNILEAAIDYVGGLEAWGNINRLRYDKTFTLFSASGEVEKTFKQIHDYTTRPKVIDIQSTENGTLIHTRFADNVYTQTADGEPTEKTPAVIEKGLNTSTYVIGLPYKLLDPGAEITYAGERTMDTGLVVDVLQVSYSPAQNANHSSADTWYFYFDQDNQNVVANFIESPDHFSLVENTSFQRVGKTLFYKDRKSYRVDSLGNKLYLRAEYTYENFLVE
ncbi:MAG: DUF6503 family protein [Bacteroidota bacterium]